MGNFLQFQLVKNPGAAFSLGTGMTWLFSIIGVGVLGFIVLFARRIQSFSWAILFGLLLGGTLGNLSDRLFREPRFGEGHVVDFIQVIALLPRSSTSPTARSWSSMCLFVLLTIRGVRLDGNVTATPSDCARRWVSRHRRVNLECCGSAR